MILDNLARALEYEKQSNLYFAGGKQSSWLGFTELAKKRGLKNYLELMAPQNFEVLFKYRSAFTPAPQKLFFREYLDIGPVSTSSLPSSSASYAQENFRYLLAACRGAPFKGTPAKASLAAAFQKACTATQNSLKVRLSLDFFCLFTLSY